METRKKALIALSLGLALPSAYVFARCSSQSDMRQVAAEYCSPLKRPLLVYAAVFPANARRLCALWGFQ